MAWVAGADRLTGDLITSAQWNNYLGATGSLEYLKGRFNWLAASVELVADLNRSTDLAFTDKDITANTSATAAWAVLRLCISTDSTGGSGDMAQLAVRRNGDTPTNYPDLWTNSNNGDLDGAYVTGMVIVGLDASQIFEYAIQITGTIQVDSWIHLLGYIDG